MRLLTRDEVELIWTIDRSEVHHYTYELREGELVRVPNYFEVPGWRPDAAAKETPVLLDRFDRGGTFVGVFDAETLIGMSVLESARVGRGRDQMQLSYLYQPHRSWARRRDAAIRGGGVVRTRGRREGALRLTRAHREHRRLLSQSRLCPRA